LEEVMTEVMFQTPSDPTIVKVIITPESVRGGSKPELLRDPNRLERPTLGKAALRAE
jgi:ATP-dependent Clp protease ATP-binding subunit ClpX